MKHIKKKYLLYIKGENSEQNSDFDSLFHNVEDLNNNFLKEKSKSNNLLLKFREDEFIFAFIYNHNGTYVNIPLPDYTLIYFDNAYNLNIQRRNQQKLLLTKLTNIKTLSDGISHELYMFYGTASAVVINLFTALESFANSILPTDKNYIDNKSNRTEIYNVLQIQESISFWDKLKYVLPQLLNANYFKDQTPNTQHITNLKELRDDIIHTKSDNTYDTQIKLLTRILKFKYDETFVAVSHFMNFYKKGYIEECKCGNDY
jgi:hypothetical protein